MMMEREWKKDRMKQIILNIPKCWCECRWERETRNRIQLFFPYSINEGDNSIFAIDWSFPLMVFWSADRRTKQIWHAALDSIGLVHLWDDAMPCIRFIMDDTVTPSSQTMLYCHRNGDFDDQFKTITCDGRLIRKWNDRHSCR